MDINASTEEVVAANAYEKLHVPALFRQWAPRVIHLAQLKAEHKVLDVACGTGILAREVAKILNDPQSITGLDVSAGMLTVAQQMAPSIRWQQGSAESLPFEDASFDRVLSQFGLMFFRDRIAALEEMHRVLVRRGRIVVAVWESLENSEAYPDEVALLKRLAGDDAANALKAPFVLGDKLELKNLFEDAGFIEVKLVTQQGVARFPSIHSMVEADLRGWLPVMGVNLDEASIHTILREAERTLKPYVSTKGSVEFSSPAHIVTAIKW